MKIVVKFSNWKRLTAVEKMFVRDKVIKEVKVKNKEIPTILLREIDENSNIICW